METTPSKSRAASRLVAIPGSERSPVPGARRVSSGAPDETVSVTVVLRPKTAISGPPADSSLALDAEAVGARHDEFAQQYGAHHDALTALRHFAAQHKLSVTDEDPKRRVVELSGAASDVENAFGTTLSTYEIDGTTFRGREGPVLLPQALAQYVEAVLGLDSRPAARPRIAPRAAPTTSFFPNELAALYDFPPGDGKGVTVALIELGGNFDPNDLKHYFDAAGTPMPSVKAVSVSPGFPVPYGSDPDSDGEVMLDIEVIGAIAPGANIVVYFAANTDVGFYQAVSRAVHDPATSVVSISWGGAERYWSAQTMNAWDTLAQSADRLHVGIFAASGDHGAADQTPPGADGHAHVDFPASVPHVIACGGTSLQTAGGKKTGETVWNNHNGWATGGGISAHFPLPVWQHGLTTGPNSPLRMRGVPDVAGDADPNTGIKTRSNGQDGVTGGTSAVAPLWAALTAIIVRKLNAKQGFYAPTLYALPSVLNDILAGDNGAFGVPGFHAQHGWDGCTGLGSPIGNAVLTALQHRTPPLARV